METKSIFSIEVEKNGRNYSFNIPVGAPFGEVYDAAFDMLNHVLELAKNAADKAKPKEPEVQ